MNPPLPPQAPSHHEIRPGLVIEGDEVVRTLLPERTLRHFRDDESAVYGPKLIEHLGASDLSDKDMLRALLDATAEVHAQVEEITGIPVLPATLEETDDSWRLRAPRLVEPEDVTLDQRFSFLPGVTEYYEYVVDNAIALVNGEADEPIVYHNDLTRVNQYMFGSVDGEVPHLILTDLDTEIDTAGEQDEYGWMIDKHVPWGLIDLATGAHYYSDGEAIMEKVEELAERLRVEGMISDEELGRIQQGYELGYQNPDWEDEFLPASAT